MTSKGETPMSSRGIQHWLRAVLMVMICAGLAALARAADVPGEGRVTLDQLSVIKVHVHAVPDARTRATLGSDRDGTGIVLDSSGLILTIGYLVQEAETVVINAADGQQFPANVVGFDQASGLGLLRAMTKLTVKPIDLGESNGVRARELVLIVGFDGIAPALVVSRRSFVGSWEYLLDDAIYTAPATVNWQGAALIDKQGKLIGVGSLLVGDAIGGSSRVPGNVFVPIDLLKPVLGDLIAQGKVSRLRPWVGVNTQDVQGKLIVTRVSPESPAASAGLAAGDIIVGISGEKLKDQADFYRKLWASGDAGTVLKLDVLQGTEVRELDVKSIDRDSYLRTRTVY
jgi:S1-C subfamily serine protease